MTADSWKALQDLGVREGTRLEMETFYYADSESSAGTWADELRAGGSRAEVRTDRKRVGLRHRTVWVTIGTTVVPDASLARLLTLVEDFVNRSGHHDVEFD